ncbi:hypothetical protein Pcinc_014175 [Petrolisthes cinctipes]|uniref:p53 DNA-binding domain-containing protein n=1 Tax=Petrolisthes cinctipes TaxID=88211 RepID=A0AAE1FVX7_PETCI|nr:hypothetical protein Pcinc_014175 [Petrolisthes cinctipes]
MSYYHTPQERGMMQDQDSEPQFGQDVYNLFDNNFATLLEPSQDAPVEQEQQHIVFTQGVNRQTLYYENITQISEVEAGQREILASNGQVLGLPWGQIEAERNPTVQSGPEHVILQAPAPQQQECGQSILAPDNSSAFLNNYPPSLQPWNGQFGFMALTLPTDNKDRNKWCYSQVRQKLYVCPNVAVPVNVMLTDWNCNASIYITPVYKDSRYRIEPVRRCYNCKIGQSQVHAEHIVQVEGEGCQYMFVNDRYFVSTPLHPPPPGDVTSTLLVKLMCLTSCVGGPNRRPFCLVFTLRCNLTGNEIGRQVLDVKCCKCPSRDLLHEEKTSTGQHGKSAAESEKLSQVQTLASTISVGQKRKKPTSNIKLEPATGNRYENVPVPVEFVSKVKAYVNALVGEQNLKQNHRAMLPFPDH